MPSRNHSLIRYAWAAPASVVGLALGLLACALGAQAEVVDGTLEVGGGRLGGLVSRLPRFLHFGAITFGHVIVGVDPAALNRSRAHERIHVGQYERWGILFFPLYLGPSLRLFLRGRQPYWENHFERDARHKSAAAGRPGSQRPSLYPRPDWPRSAGGRGRRK